MEPEGGAAKADAKLLAALGRVSQVVKVLQLNAGRHHSLGLVQWQVLQFAASHRPEQCGVANLALELQLAKPTVSDAVKSLLGRGLLLRVHVEEDKRQFNLKPSEEGFRLALESSGALWPILEALKDWQPEKKAALLGHLLELLRALKEAGIIRVQRMCYFCQHFRVLEGSPFCSLLQERLAPENIRLDCPEFEERAENA